METGDEGPTGDKAHTGNESYAGDRDNTGDEGTEGTQGSPKEPHGSSVDQDSPKGPRGPSVDQDSPKGPRGPSVDQDGPKGPRGPSVDQDGPKGPRGPSVDQALARLRPYSRWRILTYCLVCIGFNLPGTWHMLSIVFIGGEPDAFACYRPDARDDVITDKVIPDMTFGKHCTWWNKSSEQPCGTLGFVYGTDGGPTIVTDFDLVCGREHLSETSQTVFGAGVMVGALLLPSASDRWGRVPLHLACQAAAVLFGVGLAFSDSIATFITLRFFLGALREGIGLSGIVLACELFPARQRPLAGIGLQFFWSGAWMLLTLLAFLIRNWRHLELALALICLLPAAAIWWLVPESVMWLVAKGRLQEAEKVLRKARKFDGDGDEGGQFLVELPEDNPTDNQERVVVGSEGEVIELQDQTDQASSEAKTQTSNPPHTEPSSCAGPEDKPQSSDHSVITSSAGPGDKPPSAGSEEKPQSSDQLSPLPDPNPPTYTVLSICRSRRLLLYTAVMCLLWFINIIVYYGLSLGASLKGGNRYLFFFLSGLVEIPAYGLAIVCLKQFGRQRPLAFFHFVAAVGLFGGLFGKEVGDQPVELALGMLGKFGITASLAILVLYSNEVFPTTLRNAGLGVCVTAGQVGGLLAPWAVYVAKQNPHVPVLVFGMLALLAALVGVLLPETSDHPLPQTLEDVERWEPGWRRAATWCVRKAKGVKCKRGTGKRGEGVI